MFHAVSGFFIWVEIMPSTKQTINLLTAKDLPFSRTTIWRMMRDGRLPYYKVGRRVYFDPAQVEELLKSCEHRAVLLAAQ
jgi:excisionase family DNA binding protein